MSLKDDLTTPTGRRILDHLTEKFGFLRHSTIVPGDIHGTILQEGQRSVVTYLYRELTTRMMNDDNS